MYILWLFSAFLSQICLMRKLIIAIKLYTSSPSCSVKTGWGIYCLADFADYADLLFRSSYSAASLSPADFADLRRFLVSVDDSAVGLVCSKD